MAALGSVYSTPTATVLFSPFNTNGNVTFSIEALNSSDGRVAISESDITDGSFVTIDISCTIASYTYTIFRQEPFILPVITLNGENNTIVALGQIIRIQVQPLLIKVIAHMQALLLPDLQPWIHHQLELKP